MRLPYPKSFARLLLVGFACVVVPPVAALATNAFFVDRLLDQSEQAVRTSVDLTQRSRALGELVDSLERTARQMIVLEDPALAGTYAKTRAQFQRVVQQFSTLPLDQDDRRHLGAIVAQEQKVFELVNREAPLAKGVQGLGEEFALLAKQTAALSENIGDRIEAEIKALHQLAERTKQLVLWQLLATIPLVLLMVATSMQLLARPIGQLNRAIRRLGDGDLKAEVDVRGPADLVRLGHSLNWLRLRLLDVEGQKSRFLQHVSHELKTPLTAVWDGAALLLEEVAGRLNARQREIVRILQDSSVQLRKLIEDLLNFTAAESSSNRPDVKAVRLADVVRKVTEAHTLAATAKDLELRIESTNVSVPGNEEKLRVVIDNLLSNAIKYSPPGGTVDIRIKQAGDSAVLDIVDSGPGIPEPEGNRIFDPFYQGPQAMSGTIRGSGLGLSIAREHVLAHDGRIEVVEFAPKGAHLRLVLPIPHEAEET